MSDPGALPSASLKGPLGAAAAGLVLVGFGFVAATASGMETAPTRWSGVLPLVVMLVGAALGVLGVTAIFVPRLRGVARAGAKWTAFGLVGLLVAGKILMMTGLSDG